MSFAYEKMVCYNVRSGAQRAPQSGISLISLIITIIVIIILAAIVIFSGLGTPDSAGFAGFTQQVDNVYMAVMKFNRWYSRRNRNSKHSSECCSVNVENDTTKSKRK